MKKNLRDYLFIILTVLSLSSVSVYIVIKNPILISNEENRYLSTFKYLELTSFFDGTFQNQIENAYTDQFPKRNLIVNIKNKLDNFSRSLLLSNISELTLVKIDTSTGPILRLGNSDRLINIIIEDTEENRERLKIRALEINALQERHPDVQVYVYSPTQIHETSIFNEENNIVAGAPALWEIFKENIKVPFKKFALNTLDQYKEMFYMSDHHPNHIGSDIFYNEIINFIKPEDTPLKPTSIDCHVGNTFYGTFANRSGRITAPDEFCVYMYDTADYKVYVNQKPADDYTYRHEFKDFKSDEQYPYYYNDAYLIYNPIMELDTNREDLKNILIVGDSFSNSVLDLIASHYNKTFRVTPYNTVIMDGYLFDYDTFIEENDIDVVLFMYTMENYYYKDAYGDRFEQNSILPYGGK